MSDHKLQIIPLGGLGEFGMNSMAIRYGDDIIVVDAGMMFPDDELLGVDIVTPDFSYLEQNAAHVRGLILTHGHEDHIGGVPFLLKQISVPVYGTAFTLALVERRLEEHGLLDEAKLNTVKPGDDLKLGPFSIEFIHVTHSIVSCVALAITTPLGVVIHTGDFKVDPTPTDNEPVRPAHAGRLRQARRAAADVGFDQRRSSRLHRKRARGRAAPGRPVRALAAPAGDLLLQFLDSPLQQILDLRAPVRPQSGVSRPKHDQHHRDRARSGIASRFRMACCCARRT